MRQPILRGPGMGARSACKGRPPATANSPGMASASASHGRLRTGHAPQRVHHYGRGRGRSGRAAPTRRTGSWRAKSTVTAHVAFPVAPQDNWIIWSKAPTTAEDTTLTANTSLRVHLDGSVELRVREHKYKPDVRMRTEPGIVTMGSEHTFTVSLGYEGAWFSVDGRMANFGFKNNLAWWGWDHRHNGVEMGGPRNPRALRTSMTSGSAAASTRPRAPISLSPSSRCSTAGPRASSAPRSRRASRSRHTRRLPAPWARP